MIPGLCRPPAFGNKGALVIEHQKHHGSITVGHSDSVGVKCSRHHELSCSDATHMTIYFFLHSSSMSRTDWECGAAIRFENIIWIHGKMLFKRHVGQLGYIHAHDAHSAWQDTWTLDATLTCCMNVKSYIYHTKLRMVIHHMNRRRHKLYDWAGLFSAKYSCESALSIAWLELELASCLQPDWP